MKMNYLILVITALTLTTGCTGFKAASSANGSSTLSTTDNGGGAVIIPPPTAVVAGNGANVAGVGALSVATTEGVVARLQNGLQNNANPLAGNFAKGLAQVKSNLPKVSDPTKATGFDQAQLLVYAACSDLTTGNTPLMQSTYKVTKAGTIANNKTALVAAGLQMLDQYTGGLASQSTANTQVSTALSALVDQTSAVAANTSTIAFMSVCIAANTAGTTLLGY